MTDETTNPNRWTAEVHMAAGTNGREYAAWLYDGGRYIGKPVHGMEKDCNAFAKQINRPAPTTPADDLPPGVERISDERRRQIEVEGWTPEHDAEHIGWELSRAAKCYIEAADYASANSRVLRPTPVAWPWDVSAWKPTTDPVQMLAKAGALIAAEIDRLVRIPATERHDYATESLGCPDCHGEGLAPEGWVPPPVDVQRIDGKWWVLVEGRRVSDHRNADAARVAAQGHLR